MFCASNVFISYMSMVICLVLWYYLNLFDDKIQFSIDIIIYKIMDKKIVQRPFKYNGGLRI